MKKLYVSVAGFLGAMAAAGVTVAAITAPVPVAIGLAIFWIMSSSIDDACTEIDRDVAKSKDQREREKIIHLLKKYGAIPQFARVMTPYVDIQIDSAAGKVTGKVLRGVHRGKKLEDISLTELEELSATAPDTETADLLKAYTNIRKKLNDAK